MKKLHYSLYSFLGLFIFFADRITKQYALQHCTDPCPITNFLSFELVFNRGVTGGMFSADHPYGFIVLTLLIIGITLFVGYYSYTRIRAGYNIFGEMLVISGAVSNIIDRFIYGGVVDFIYFSYGIFSFPIFNIADVSIVLGVFLMLLAQMRE